MTLTAEDLLAGSRVTYEVTIPAEVLDPGDGRGMAGGAAARTAPSAVRLRPLTVGDLQLINRAAKESDALIATLMVQRALVEPAMTIPQVAGLHVGLLQFLLGKVNEISGISATSEQVAGALANPLVRAAFVLSQEFGWTPQEVQELTLGQILLHLKMLEGKGSA